VASFHFCNPFLPYSFEEVNFSSLANGEKSLQIVSRSNHLFRQKLIKHESIKNGYSKIESLEAKKR
jgi:hypothetical protein